MASKSLKTLVKNLDSKLREMERRPSWLAEKSGISKGMISRILNETTNPTLETLDSIADVFEISPASLIEPRLNEAVSAKIKELRKQIVDINLEMVDLRLEEGQKESDHKRQLEDYASELMEIGEIIEDRESQLEILGREITRLEKSFANSDLLLTIQSRLSAMNEKQLRSVLSFIDESAALSPAISDSDAV